MDCSPPGSSVHGILQARVLEWVAIPFSRGSSRPRDWTQVSHIPGRRFNLWATREALTHVSCGSRIVGRFFYRWATREARFSYIYILSQIIFPLRLQNIESSSLCYTVSPCWLSILYIVVCDNFPGGSDGKASVYNVGDQGSIPGLGRSPGEGNGNPFQDYCLENPMDRGAW